MDYKILPKIESPRDVKALSADDLTLLCAELREKLIEVVSVNGGHLSSNLGVVELTVALHRAFSCPEDSIVFDVGHQCYTHKMLTGRLCEIDTIRQEGGLSGFPKIFESDCDAFNAGHSSTSISAAFGIAKAKTLSGDNSYTVAVIGDGSLTGGLAYEGLNNAGRFNKNFIVVLNDNRMSISKNVGAMARYLNSIRMRPSYLRFKSKVERFLEKIPLFGKPLAGVLKRQKTRFKRVLYRNTLFDKLGFSYYGPVDGHDLNSLYNALEAAKRSKGPVMLHVITTKGKGYKFAEHDSASFHGIGSFNIDTGEPISSKTTFSAVFGEELCRLAEEDRRICAVTAAMRTGTGLVDFSKLFKERFFDVGIAEQHAVTFSAGLASKGMLPVFAVYSTFLQRGYDQILHDAAMMKEHVVLAVDRAGVVGEDGETHQGLFDVSMLNAIPNTAIFSPAYFDGLRQSLSDALYDAASVVSVRYPRGGEGFRPAGYERERTDFDIFTAPSSDVLIVTYGRIFSHAASARETLLEKGVGVSLLKLCRVKPIDEKAFDVALQYKKIFFFEEGILSGGIAESFERGLRGRGFDGAFSVTAVDDVFVHHASVGRTLKKLGLDASSIAEKIESYDKK